MTSVFYEVNLDPDAPTTFVPIAISSDANTNFALPFTISGFEPLIRATTFGPLGLPIVITEQSGVNLALGTVVAIPTAIPEPDTTWCS